MARDLAGTLVQVGAPDPSITPELPMIELDQVEKVFQRMQRAEVLRSVVVL